MRDLSRAEFVSRGAKGGVALLVGAGILGAAAGPALADDTTPQAPPEGDLAIVRFAASAELLAIDFYTQAINVRTFSRQDRAYLTAARKNEQDHYVALAKVLGTTAPLPIDFQFTYPPGTFSSVKNAVKVGVELETTFVGAYIGAVEAFVGNDLKTVAAQITASEGQHLSVMSDLKSGTPIGVAFPAPLELPTASALLDPYFGE